MSREATLSFPGPGWDEWLAGVENVDFLQGSAWAEIDVKANGRRAVVVRVGDRAGALLSLPVKPGGEAICYYGPVLRDPESLEVMSHLLDGAEESAREADAVTLRFVGHELRSRVSGLDLRQSFIDGGYRETSWLTALVDLQVGEDELFARVDRAARKGIRRCLREGLTVVRCMGQAEFEERFLQPFASVARPSYDPERDRIAFALDGGRHYSYFAALAGSEVLAVLGSYRYRGLAREIMSARTRAGRENRLPAQDLLHWHTLVHHRDLGDEVFDLAGFAAEPSNSAEAGIRRFKEKWGGVTVVVPIWERRLAGTLRRMRHRVSRALA